MKYCLIAFMSGAFIAQNIYPQYQSGHHVLSNDTVQVPQPPPGTAVAVPSFQVPQNDLDHNTRLEGEFTAFDPHYKESKSIRIARVLALLQKVQKRESAGQNISCSHQILWEIKWLITQTAQRRVRRELL